MASAGRPTSEDYSRSRDPSTRRTRRWYRSRSPAYWSTWQAATAAFSMAMCDRHPSLTATVLDLPPSAAVGRQIVAEQGYAERISFREGDVFELGLGDAERLDVVSVFNLAHHLPEERNRELCRMARAALRPGGCMVIGDSARPEPGEPVSEHGAISSLLFYAWSHSRNFTPSEISGWMADAGFDRGRGAPQRALALARGGGRAGDPAHGRHRHGRLRAAAPAHRGRPSRCAAWCATRAASATSACACRSRSATWPIRPRSATRCAASHTVVHLAASIRDQPRALDRGAERAGDAAARAGGRARRRAALRVLLGDERRATTRARASSGRRRSPRRRWRRRRSTPRSSARRSSTRPATPG